MRQFIKARIAEARTKGAAVGSAGVAEESGLVLMDGALRPIAIDSGAAAILGDSDESVSMAQLCRRIPLRILEEIRNCKVPDLPSLNIRFRLGTRVYSCRVFLVESQNPRNPGPLVALLLERDKVDSYAVRRFRAQCHITNSDGSC